MISIRETSLTIISESKYYIIFPFLSDNILYLKQFLFSSKNEQNGVKVVHNYYKQITETIGKSISCYKCPDYDWIICFYLIKSNNNKNTNNNYGSIYNIIALNTNLQNLTIHSFQTNIFYEKSFYKCIHLRNNVGVFIYYALNSNKILLI